MSIAKPENLSGAISSVKNLRLLTPLAVDQRLRPWRSQAISLYLPQVDDADRGD